MVTDICLRFNALDPALRAICIPLPAVVCIGEAARAVTWLCQIGEEACAVAIEPLRETLEYAMRSWGLAGMEEYPGGMMRANGAVEYYLRQLG
jgi:hypothetical protein